MCSRSLWLGVWVAMLSAVAMAQQAQPVVLHAARLLQVDSGTVMQPGEVLVEGNRIKAVGKSVEHPAGAKVIDLGSATLMPASSRRCR